MTQTFNVDWNNHNNFYGDLKNQAKKSGKAVSFNQEQKQNSMQWENEAVFLKDQNTVDKDWYPALDSLADAMTQKFEAAAEEKGSPLTYPEKTAIYNNQFYALIEPLYESILADINTTHDNQKREEYRRRLHALSKLRYDITAPQVKRAYNKKVKNLQNKKKTL